MIRLWLSAYLVIFATISSASAGILEFAGKVFSEGGGPAANALVIPGTFAPAFNPFNYTSYYGDVFNNLLPDAYDIAVTDGNFMPAGNGVVTDAGGNFFWLGNSSLSPGQQLWFFVFEGNNTGAFFQVLATSTAANWLSPSVSGSTSILASEANQFVMGQSFADGVALSVIPFPEPSSLLLGLAALATTLQARRSMSVR